MDYDIVIVGGGISGATLALLLAHYPNFRIALLEHKPLVSSSRVSAISLTSMRIFQEIEVWNKIANTATPYTKMHVVSDEASLNFNCSDIQTDALGYIVPDYIMREQLMQSLAEYTHLDFYCPIEIAHIEAQSHGIKITMQNDLVLTAKLIVGADGVHSLVRSFANIFSKQKSYGQEAIVATVRTSLPHQETAWQRFLPTGPIAFLPLKDTHLCSIVWSLKKDKAAELIALSDQDFSEALHQAFNLLGDIQSVGPRFIFPLNSHHAERYAEERIVLIGDAAHTLHPLAGQGVNLGLMDASILAEVLIAAAKKGRCFYSLATLRKFERQCRANNMTMLAFVDFVNGLFLHENKWVHKIRSLGLNSVDRFLLLKRYFCHYAIGGR